MLSTRLFFNFSSADEAVTSAVMARPVLVLLSLLSAWQVTTASIQPDLGKTAIWQDKTTSIYFFENESIMRTEYISHASPFLVHLPNNSFLPDSDSQRQLLPKSTGAEKSNL